jgi:hypothetical protein
MLAPLVLSVAAGCVGTSEPTSPCPAIDLGHAEPATFVTPSDAPVVAVSHGEDQSFVAHRVCEPDDGPCRIVRTPLEDLPPGSQVLLTASGKHIVGVAASFGQTLVLTWDVGPDGVTPGKSAWAEDATAAPAALVGSMRGLPGDTDWVIARTAPNADGTRKLLRYKPGQQGNPEYLATNVPELLVSAIGERFLVGRQVHNGGEETLHLVDVLDDFTRDEARPLLRGRTFSRVMLSPGDAMVIATSGEGEDAETFVFDTDDGTLLDRFSGAAVSGRARGEELPGMRAVSPDGSALAYRTPGGAIALRSLDAQSSCLVRSSAGGGHEVAGFSASGVLYMEAERGLGGHRIFAFDPIVRRLTALGDPTGNMRLAGVPARDPLDAEGVPVGHWALGVENGQYAELRHDPIREEGTEERLPLGDVMIIPREDEAIWLVNSDTHADGTVNAPFLQIHRLAPRIHPESGALEVERSATLVESHDDPDAPAEPLELRLSRVHPVCVSTGGPGLSAFGCALEGGSARLVEFTPSTGEQSGDPALPPQVQPDEPQGGDASEDDDDEGDTDGDTDGGSGSDGG